ncbi:MAG TPA: VOC family protein [Polyangiaceae bacterium]|jgi:predicted enzyme related to lactoylglutathione lyase|nr:VOC family protein [Polyangiaceae bacterium]
MTISVSVSIDVPSLAEGIAFYCAAFGLSKKSEPVPGVAVLGGLDVEVVLLEKHAGSQPSPETKDRRTFERHWTPVHLDFHVDDLPAALEKVEALGAKREQVFENPDYGSAAFCCDPFGHGFCLLARKAKP